MSEIALPAVGRTRTVAFYVVVGFFCLFMAVFLTFVMPILPSVLLGWFNADLFGIHQLHEMNSAALALLILAGMALQLRHPERKTAGLLMVIVGIASGLIVNIAVGINPMEQLPFILFPLAAAALHPRRAEMLRPGRIGQPVLLALVAVAAAPLLVYAVRQANLQLSAPPADPHAQFTHYSSMAGLALGILLIGLLGSLDISGWRIPAWGAGFLALFFGLTSVVFPGQTSSVGTLWAGLAVVWGLAFIAFAEWRRRADG